MSEYYADKDNEDYNISASQVKSHAKCPLQYWMRYIEGKENTKMDSDYITLGSRVHESIEEVLKSDEVPLEHPEAVKAAFQNTYAEMEGFELPQDLYDDGLKCCRKAAEYLCKREPEIVGVEKRVEYDIERPDMGTGVTAIMDIVTEDEIWDWKTGRIRNDTAHEEKIQGSIYMAAFYDEYGREPESIRFVYVKEGKVRTLDPTDENWQYMLSRAKSLLRAKEEGEFPAKPGDHCYWCGYEFWCPEASTGMGNVPWEDY